MKNRNYIISRITTAVVCLVMSFSVFGQDKVDLNLATRVGENFIKMNDGIALSGEAGSLQRVQTDKFPNLYIFNADGHGFIIVAGDKRMQPILGFSYESAFDPNDMAPAAEMIIGGYDYVVDSLVRNNVRATDESVAQAWRDLERGYYESNDKGDREDEPEYPLAYGPLIRTDWGQGEPGDGLYLESGDWFGDWHNNYNQRCPWTELEEINNGSIHTYRAITGCTATVMAQLLYYYNKNLPYSYSSFPFRSYDNHTYYLIDMNGVKQHSVFDPMCTNNNNNYYFEVGGWNYSQSNTMDFATKMMLDCGLLLGTAYGLIASSAPFEVLLSSLKYYFGFSKAEIKERNNYDYNSWIIELKKSICATMPICYRGNRNSGNNEPGHVYILDGYYTTSNDVLFRHVGVYNGYFSINQAYNLNQRCIILAPVPDTINRTINFRDQFRKTIHNKEYVVKYGLTPSVSQTQIVYNAPGDYHIHDTYGNTDIFINVKVLPTEVPDFQISKTICKGEPYYKDPVDNQGHIYIFKLSSDSTNFDGTKNFVRYYYDDVSGIITGKCTLTLTTKRCNSCPPEINCLNNGSRSSKDGQTTNQIIYNSVTKYHEYVNAMDDFMLKVLMDAYWQDDEKRINFWNLFQSLLDSNTGLITEQGIQQLINQSQLEGVSDDYIRFIAGMYNQSVLYWNEGYYTNEMLPEGYDGVIEYDTAAMRKAYEAQTYAESLGFNDVREMYDNAYEMLEAEVENSQNSVCATVTVQFTQKMTMTREAFNGTLQIFNGHETLPMEDILVDFRIKDPQGNDCTNLFQINPLSLDQITGISGDGSLAAQTNGTVSVQFIPTRNAAPTEPVVYSFGGSFSFIDPFTGEGLTYSLYPVEITVNPSPDLYVDYFMQRDILGDDALTTDVIERSEPAELGVIIHNMGAGMVKNVILETAEPEIIDNEKGLAIDFAMYGASFNGSPRQLGLTSIPFGNIGSGQTAVGEWLFASSLLGHFVSYQANVIHNSSYGNADLSLVSHLDIHELIHPIYAYGSLDDGINDFLVNDNPDAYDLPDSIYFSQGGRTAVGIADGISFDHAVASLDTVVTLTLVPSRVGWNYGVTDDPGNDLYEIVSCIRNYDNQVIPLNNIWQTFVTIPDGGDPVYENKLHIVDTLSVQQSTTYTLVFRRKPSNLRIFNGNEDEYWSNVANWENGIKAQTDDDVLINGICLLDEDADVFSLTVAANKSLTIPSGRILTTSGTLTSEATSRLVIQDGGQLRHRNEGVQATVQKDIEPYTNNYNGYYLIATPLVGFTAPASVVNMLSNDYDLYYFDQSQELEWINYEGNDGGYDLVPGKGYLYANSEGIVLEFPGELRSGATTLTVPLIYAEGAEFIGFNLVGNPFAYNLTTYAAHNVAEGCYRMNEAKDDLIVSEISESNPLKPAEGFFVKATDAGAYITFNPQMTSMAPQGSINVELSENNLLIDRLIVKTHKGYPLEKFNLKATRSKLFAQGSRHECAIVPCESHEQPVNFKAAKNGTYTINVNVDDMEFYYLHLIDNLTGNDVNLLAEPNYTFEAHTTDYASRFLLRFIPKGDIETGSENDNFAYNFNGTWIIANEGDATLQVVDIMGRILSSERISGCSEKHIQAAAGVYLLRLINGDDVRTQKIVID